MNYSKILLTAAIGLSIVACNSSTTKPPLDGVNTTSEPDSLIGKDAVKTAKEPDSLDGKYKYANPVDGKVYVGSEKFKEYTPEGGTPKPEGPNYMKSAALLTSMRMIPDNIGVDTLASFMKAQEAFVLNNIKNIKTVGRLLIQFHLHHNTNPTVKVTYDGKFDENQLRQLDAGLRKYCSNHRTQKDSVVYQMLFMVNDANYAK